MERYSLGYVIVTAIVTFLFSGILGALFKNWIDRADLRLIVTSFGFCGNKDSIEIPSELQRLSGKCAWIPSLRRYEKYEKLLKISYNLRRIREQLKLGQASVEKWLSENKSWEVKDSVAANIDELDRCPFFAESIILNTLFGAAKRAEITSLPVPIYLIEDSDSITEFSSNGDDWHLYMRRMNVRFPIQESKGVTEKEALLAIGVSLSKGCKANIFHYIQEFRRHAVEGINQIVELDEKLESLLLPVSRIAVNVVVANVGARPETIRPFGKLIFHNQEIAGYSSLLQIEAEEQFESASVQSQKMVAFPRENEYDDGDNVLVDEMFPSAGYLRHIFSAPKSSKEFRFVSVEALGDASERILNMYKASILQCSVLLLNASGGTIQSPAVLFGKSVSRDDVVLLGVKK